MGKGTILSDGTVDLVLTPELISSVYGCKSEIIKNNGRFFISVED
jgi:ABC-type cobalamin/Fe3+-siderophores transport system ATPase subunit